MSEDGLRELAEWPGPLLIVVDGMIAHVPGRYELLSWLRGPMVPWMTVAISLCVRPASLE